MKRAKLHALPKQRNPVARSPLPTIAGSVPPLHALPPGCPFAGRCAYTIAACHAALPPLADLGDGHGVRCIRPEAIAGAAP